MKSTRIPHPFRSVILATLAAASFPLASVPSQAADPRPNEQSNSQTVHYGDLNIHSDQGLAQLYQRIVAAATGACGDSDANSLEAWSQARACKSRSIARAVAAINIPGLTALYARKTATSATTRG
jgi:UrcA family protein